MGGWGGSVIFVRHNLSIIPPVEHNFEHNTLVLRVTPESIILIFFEHNPADPIFNRTILQLLGYEALNHSTTQLYTQSLESRLLYMLIA